MKNIYKIFIGITIIFSITSCGVANQQEPITMANPPSNLETEESLRSKQLEEKKNLDEEQIDEEVGVLEENSETVNTAISNEEEIEISDEEIALEVDSSYELLDFSYEEESGLSFIDVFNPLLSSDLFESITYIGEYEDKYYYLHNYSKEESIISSILSTNKDFTDLRNIKRLDTSIDEGAIELSDIIIDADKYNESVFKYNLTDSYMVYDMNFELIEEVSLPDDFIDIIESDGFTGWDISNDFNTITYAHNETGFSLYYIDQESSVLIGYNYAGSNGREGDFMTSPYFLMNDEYISTVRYIDDVVTGHNIYNLSTNNFTILSNAVEESIYEDTGLYVYYLDGGIYGTYYDFTSDSRIERGISYDFELDSVDKDLNILHKHYNLNSKDITEEGRKQWTAFDLISKEDKILFSYLDEGYSELKVFANLNDKIIFLAPFSINGSRMIVIEL